MKALLAQLDPSPDPRSNVDRAIELIADHADCDLTIFPELFLGGYAPTRLEGRAFAAEDPLLERIGRSCQEVGTAAIVGFAERLPEPEAAYANSALCFDRDGRRAGIYRKTHLFGPDERAAFRAGEGLRLVELGGVVVGVMICFDAEFPEPARSLAADGADLLVTIAANMEPYEEDHRLATRARALDNRRHHLYVNRVGTESGYRFVGCSRAVDQGGAVIAELGAEEEARTVAIQLGDGPDPAVDYLRLRRNLPVTGPTEREREAT